MESDTPHAGELQTCKKILNTKMFYQIFKDFFENINKKIKNKNKIILDPGIGFAKLET